MTATQTFEPDGRAIPYVDEGKGPGLVLIPSLGLNVGALGTLATSLVRADFRVVRIGSRRPSAASAPAPSLHDLAQDVVDVMDGVGLADAWIGGHAFGGAVARTVSRDHTDRVDGVLLLGVETAAADETPGRDADVAEILEHLRDPEVDSLQRAALAATPAADWATPAAGVPVLAIQGTDDRITPESHGAALQSAAPDRVSVVAIAGGGHWFPITHAGETSWAIEDYLDWD